MKESLLKMKNIDFIFECLAILEREYREDDILKLTDQVLCKRRFDMNYAVLRKVCEYGSVASNMFLDKSGNRRYYPDVVTIFGERYIVCNDWYYKNKSNTRDTRSGLVNWVLGQ